MLRDFPITGNEGATRAQGYPSVEAGMFVNKEHGLKERDTVAPNKGSKGLVHILHIDSSRDDVDYIQFDRPLYHITDGYFRDTIAFISRGDTSELLESNEIAFRAMRGEKMARSLPLPTALELQEEEDSKMPKAFIRTESLQVTKDSYDFRTSSRYQVYKGHGLIPSDTVALEGDSMSPSTYVIQDIVSGEQYDEIVLDNPTDTSGGLHILLQFRMKDESFFTPDQVANRDAYLRELQAS